MRIHKFSIKFFEEFCPGGYTPFDANYDKDEFTIVRQNLLFLSLEVLRSAFINARCEICWFGEDETAFVGRLLTIFKTLSGFKVWFKRWGNVTRNNRDRCNIKLLEFPCIRNCHQLWIWYSEIASDADDIRSGVDYLFNYICTGKAVCLCACA